MRRIGIAVNQNKPSALDVTKQLVSLLEAKDAKVLVDSKVADQIGRSDLALDVDKFPDQVDLVFVLGGDGTLLGVARQLAVYDLPILGINLGHLGFLSEAEPEDLPSAVDRVLRGDYHLEKRMMIDASIIRNGQTIHRNIALNDIGIAKGSFGRMVTLSVYVDDMYVDKYSGDGLIISTPTGSTAYSLSCGGPIVSPHINVMVVTPICPHTLTSRPFIVQKDQVIRVEVSATHNDIGITIDGQVGYKGEVNDTIIVRKSPHYTTLIKWQERGFFDVLRQKLHNPN
ncbi:NAD(+)/NADH kinase [Effusibacillus lacus]|uniref:NAD kinase n=1 Tax=Effusibacillus lacus TaxID=1348429 RepID=A0A292YE18_9BACL|nr:NAD(+)/NADH kinase [Effusibacillus lacus]TCS72513.1 NAD+ kinase [Effusibacillus lacus]GAX90922.1 NAD(+) kinase [Effusibacillus lacus]